MLPQYALLPAWLSDVELGDVATWVGALANVATLALATVAAVVGFRVYKIESGRDRRAEDERRERALDARRSQAQLVSIWYNGPRHAPGVAYVLNASNLPAYELFLHFTVEPPVEFLGVFEDATEDWPWNYLFGFEDIKVLPPHIGPQAVPLTESLVAAIQACDLPFEGIYEGIRVTMAFRDAAGRMWRREENGVLTQL
ncbi:hypothetical protein [Micromonospora costi]|uniref:Uncharacterized protein n=1 Tax=Micromonospora costi TaxID=1530042 RepID=A0A3B0A6Y7_9ACTN|nr:hypothetical protein [Micromonospora costi]RKN55974.1 hypothetical protein D7193_15425 [Micromonospora costi]